MSVQNNYSFRKAVLEDSFQLEKLIKTSALSINNHFYSYKVIASAIGTVWTLDKQLIKDGTYWVVENKHDKIIACGGWSERALLFGKQEIENEIETKLIPGIDAAKIRAFFVDPNYVRQGIGKSLLEICEQEAKTSGYTSLELVATLSGEKLYASKGFKVLEKYEVETEKGIFNQVISMFKTIA